VDRRTRYLRKRSGAGAKPLRIIRSRGWYPVGRDRGFTLLEILLVIALIGITTAVLVVGGVRSIGDRSRVPPQEIFWEAVAKARKHALFHQTPVVLSFDREKRELVARTSLGQERFALPGDRELHLDFLSTQRAGNTVLIGGTLVETHPLPGVTFYEDGTCTPFRLQLRQGSDVQIFAIDPWTCAPMLAPEGVQP
jgi:prepilin-type N-terminal cleavage/methylation domain-containing protein